MGPTSCPPNRLLTAVSPTSFGRGAMAGSVLWILTLAFPVSMLTTGCSAGLRHPDFTAHHSSIHRLSVLTPEIEVYKLTFRGDKQMMYELLEPLAQQAVEELDKALTKRGYEIKPLDLSNEALNAQPELRQNLHTVRTLFAQQLEQYQKRWFTKLRGFRYSIGAEINLFADQAGSDALVMMRCVGFKKTGGEIAKDVAKTVLIMAASLGNVMVYWYPSATLIQLAVIDGNTGDILWYIDNKDQGGFDIAKEKAFRKTVRRLMSKFPKAAAVPAAPSSASLPHSDVPSVREVPPIPAVGSP